MTKLSEIDIDELAAMHPARQHLRSKEVEDTPDLFSPWTFRREGCQIYGTTPGRAKLVANLSISYWGEDEINRAGHLIAAAPDLLEALDRVYHAVHAMDLVEIGSLNLDAACDAAEKAIAKAKGQTP